MSSVVGGIDDRPECLYLVEQVGVRSNRFLEIPRCSDVLLAQVSAGHHLDDVVADLLELLTASDRFVDLRRVLSLLELVDVEGRGAPEAVLPEARRPVVALGTQDRRDRRGIRYLVLVFMSFSSGDLRARLPTEPGDVVRGGLRPTDPPEVRLQVGLRDTGLHRQNARSRPSEVTGVKRPLDAGALPETVEHIPETVVRQPLRRVVLDCARLRADPQRRVGAELTNITCRVDLQPLPEVRRADGDTDVSRAGLRVRRDGDDEVISGVSDVPDVQLLELRFRPEPAAPLDGGHRAIAPGLRGPDHRDDVILPVEDAGGLRRRVTVRIRRLQDVLPVWDTVDGRERVDQLRQAADKDVHRVVSVPVCGERGHVLLSGLTGALLRFRRSAGRNVFLIDKQPVEAGDVASSEANNVQMASVGRSLGRGQARGELSIELLDEFSILFGQFCGRSDPLAFVFDSACHWLVALRWVVEFIFKGWSVSRRYVLDDRASGPRPLRPVKRRSMEWSIPRQISLGHSMLDALTVPRIKTRTTVRGTSVEGGVSA